MSKLREVPVVTDSMVNRMPVRSVFYIRNSIKRETGVLPDDWEEWLNGPRRIVERLADRLACAEDCIRKEVKWPGYRALLRQIESE